MNLSLQETFDLLKSIHICVAINTELYTTAHIRTHTPRH